MYSKYRYQITIMNILVRAESEIKSIAAHLTDTTDSILNSNIMVHAFKFENSADCEFDNIVELHVEGKNNAHIMRLPKNLQSLRIDNVQTIDLVWPSYLQILHFENAKELLMKIELPTTLHTLILGRNCNCDCGFNILLPSDLKTFIALDYTRPIQFPTSLKVLHLGLFNLALKSLLNLKELVLGKYNCALPFFPKLKRLIALSFNSFSPEFNVKLKHLCLPNATEYLKPLSKHQLKSLTLPQYHGKLELPNTLKHLVLYNMTYSKLPLNLKSCVMQQTFVKEQINMTHENIMHDFQQLSENVKQPWKVKLRSLSM